MEHLAFNEIFSKLADSSNYTDAEIARRLDVNRSTVGRWKSGEQSPPLSKIPVIASLFDVHPMVLVGGEDREKSQHSEDENALSKIEVSDDELRLLQKYNKLDNRGKHTVNTVLDMEFNRVTKPHLEVVAAHNDDYSEEQIRLMREDLDDL